MVNFYAILLLASYLFFPTYFFKNILSKYLTSLTRLEIGFFSIFLGQIFFVSFIFLGTFVFGLTWPAILLAISPFVIFDIKWLKERKKIPKLEFQKSEKPFLIVILVLSVLFLILLRRHTLPETPDGFFTPHNTFGDIQYHLAMINSFYLGDNFPPQNPIYAGVRLSYPFMIDFYSAVFRYSGFNIQNSLTIPALLFGITFFAFFLFFSHRFLKSFSGSVLATTIFLFNGGMGGFLTLKEVTKSAPFFESLGNSFSYVIDKYNFRFPNAVSSVYMAERPILVGMSAFFAILILLYIAFEKKKSDREIFWAGIIIGTLPLWHTHTIVVLGITLPFYFLIRFFIGKVSILENIKFFLPMLYIAIPLGIIGMSWHLDQVFSGGHFFSIKKGWIVGEEGPLVFWYRNLGIFIPLLVASFFVVTRKQMIFYFPVFLIFLFSNYINFQPFDWDNYKILIVWYAVSAVLVAELFLLLQKRFKIFGKIFTLGAMSVFIISGAILMVGDYVTYFGLFSNEDIELADWERENTNPSDIILTGPQHDQFSILAGRKLLMGYPGYLWTQGIDSSVRGEDIRKMYAGNIELIRKYNVKFIVVGYNEREVFKPDESFLDKNFPLVKKTQHFKIYKVI